MSKCYSSVFSVILLLLLCILPAWGHDLTDREVTSIGTTIELGIWEDMFYVDYWIAIGDLEALNFYSLIDTDKNGIISEEEKETFLDGLQRNIVTNGLEIEFDGRSDLSFALYSSKILLAENKNEPVPIKINLEFLLDLERLKMPGLTTSPDIAEQKQHSFTFYMTNTLSKTVLLKVFIAQGKGIDITYSPEQRSRALIFKNGFWFNPGDYNGLQLNYEDISNNVKPKFNRPTTLVDAASANPGKDRILNVLRNQSLSLWMIIIGLGLAFIYGAGHALTPGHGKTLVGAYLIGSRGTIPQAIILGLVVTATHLFTVIIAGILALEAAQYINQTALAVYLGFASGVVIVILGLWLFVRRLTHPLGVGHHHHHKHHIEHHNHNNNEHHHDEISHSHSDEIQDLEKVRLKHILALGITGGIIPCPTAIVVLLMAITIKKTLWGLFLILAFSLGLASVLILIGILMVGGISLVKPSGRFLGFNTAKIIRFVSIISPALIVFIGIAMIISELISSGVIILNPQALP
ncbi:MAG: sulfite exporter TauE/SafE family protein [Planctomycetota bacterium]